MNEWLAAIGHARAVGDPVHVARPNAFIHQAVRIRAGRYVHDALCELDPSGIRISGSRVARTIVWPDARSISVDRGQVNVVSPTGSIAMAVALDGVVEPSLAPLFARVLEQGRAGRLQPNQGALHELALGIDRVLERFGDADDPIIPLAVGAFAIVASVILALALPPVLHLVARIEPATGTFAMLPRVVWFDPRVLVAAAGGAVALAVAVTRGALGPSAVTWARGTLRGWHRNAFGADALGRQAVARLTLAPRTAALVAAIALLLLVPSAFARTVVDADGIHSASGLPFISRDLGWHEVTAVEAISVGFNERYAGFDTLLRFADGSSLSTRGRDLVGGSERSFYDFARSHAR